MTTSFKALCHDFYINQKLALKMDLPTGRETVLDMFDRVRKSRPGMERLRRFDGEYALESIPRDSQYDWMALRQTAIRSGSVNPTSLTDAYDLHRLILQISPYYLSINSLDIDYLELMFGFDLEAPGNHDEIVFDALFADTPFGKLIESGRMDPLDVQPFLTFALDESRRLQVNFEVKTRTAADMDQPDDPVLPGMGGGPGEDEPISVFLSLRRFGPIDHVDQLKEIFDTLSHTAEQLATDHVVPQLIAPITRAINSRSR